MIMNEWKTNLRSENWFFLLTFLATFSIFQIKGNKSVPPSGEIINGKETMEKEFGYITSIWRKSDPNTHIGGGSILNPRWVLTVRHNFVSLHEESDVWIPDFFEVVVTPGYSRKLSKLKPRTKYKVEKYFCPLVKNGEHQIMFDIGLLKMERDMRSGRLDRFYPPSIPLISISEKSKFDNAQAKFAGWGFEKQDQIKPTKVLKKFDGKLNRVKCSDYYIGIKEPHVYCFFSDNSVVCDGDGGGPLVTEKNQELFQFGVIVGGTPGCLDKYPGVYINLHYYRKWIDEVMNYEEDKHLCKDFLPPINRTGIFLSSMKKNLNNLNNNTLLDQA